MQALSEVLIEHLGLSKAAQEQSIDMLKRVADRPNVLTTIPIRCPAVCASASWWAWRCYAPQMIIADEATTALDDNRR